MSEHGNMDYLIADGENVESLRADVNMWISLGYVPTGGVFTFKHEGPKTYYGQAMVRKEALREDY